eukprot:jgi/Mesvir1/21240/Mv06672-RA.1
MERSGALDQNSGQDETRMDNSEEGSSRPAEASAESSVHFEMETPRSAPAGTLNSDMAAPPTSSVWESRRHSSSIMKSVRRSLGRVLWKKSNSHDRRVFNPEIYTSQKRLWNMQRQKQLKGHAEGPQHALFEHFVVVGLPPSTNGADIYQDAKAAMRRSHSQVKPHRAPLLPTYEPEILFKYPAGKKLCADHVASFCFPFGAQPFPVERTPSMSHINEVVFGQRYLDEEESSYIFLLQSGESAPLYGVCMVVNEMLNHPPGVARPKDALKDTSCASSMPLSRYLVASPRCYCLLTYYPFFDLHFEVLASILAQERLIRITEMADVLAAETPGALMRVRRANTHPIKDTRDDEPGEAPRRPQRRSVVLRGLLGLPVEPQPEPEPEQGIELALFRRSAGSFDRMAAPGTCNGNARWHSVPPSMPDLGVFARDQPGGPTQASPAGFPIGEVSAVGSTGGASPGAALGMAGSDDDDYVSAPSITLDELLGQSVLQAMSPDPPAAAAGATPPPMGLEAGAASAGPIFEPHSPQAPPRAAQARDYGRLRVEIPDAGSSSPPDGSGNAHEGKPDDGNIVMGGNVAVAGDSSNNMGVSEALPDGPPSSQGFCSEASLAPSPCPAVASPQTTGDAPTDGLFGGDVMPASEPGPGGSAGVDPGRDETGDGEGVPAPAQAGASADGVTTHECVSVDAEASHRERVLVYGKTVSGERVSRAADGECEQTATGADGDRGVALREVESGGMEPVLMSKSAAGHQGMRKGGRDNELEEYREQVREGPREELGEERSDAVEAAMSSEESASWLARERSVPDSAEALRDGTEEARASTSSLQGGNQASSLAGEAGDRVTGAEQGAAPLPLATSPGREPLEPLGRQGGGDAEERTGVSSCFDVADRAAMVRGGMDYDLGNGNAGNGVSAPSMSASPSGEGEEAAEAHESCQPSLNTLPALAPPWPRGNEPAIDSSRSGSSGFGAEGEGPDGAVLASVPLDVESLTFELSLSRDNTFVERCSDAAANLGSLGPPSRFPAESGEATTGVVEPSASRMMGAGHDSGSAVISELAAPLGATPHEGVDGVVVLQPPVSSPSSPGASLGDGDSNNAPIEDGASNRASSEGGASPMASELLPTPATKTPPQGVESASSSGLDSASSASTTPGASDPTAAAEAGMKPSVAPETDHATVIEPPMSSTASPSVERDADVASAGLMLPPTVVPAPCEIHAAMAVQPPVASAANALEARDPAVVSSGLSLPSMATTPMARAMDASTTQASGACSSALLRVQFHVTGDSIGVTLQPSADTLAGSDTPAVQASKPSTATATTVSGDCAVAAAESLSSAVDVAATPAALDRTNTSEGKANPVLATDAADKPKPTLSLLAAFSLPSVIEKLLRPITASTGAGPATPGPAAAATTAAARGAGAAAAASATQNAASVHKGVDFQLPSPTKPGGGHTFGSAQETCGGGPDADNKSNAINLATPFGLPSPGSGDGRVTFRHSTSMAKKISPVIVVVGEDGDLNREGSLKDCAGGADGGGDGGKHHGRHEDVSPTPRSVRRLMRMYSSAEAMEKLGVTLPAANLVTSSISLTHQASMGARQGGGFGAELDRSGSGGGAGGGGGGGVVASGGGIPGWPMLERGSPLSPRRAAVRESSFPDPEEGGAGGGSKDLAGKVMDTILAQLSPRKAKRRWEMAYQNSGNACAIQSAPGSGTGSPIVSPLAARERQYSVFSPPTGAGSASSLQPSPRSSRDGSGPRSRAASPCDAPAMAQMDLSDDGLQVVRRNSLDCELSLSRHSPTGLGRTRSNASTVSKSSRDGHGSLCRMGSGVAEANGPVDILRTDDKREDTGGAASIEAEQGPSLAFGGPSLVPDGGSERSGTLLQTMQSIRRAEAALRRECLSCHGNIEGCRECADTSTGALLASDIVFTAARGGDVGDGEQHQGMFPHRRTMSSVSAFIFDDTSSSYDGGRSEGNFGGGLSSRYDEEDEDWNEDNMNDALRVIHQYAHVAPPPPGASLLFQPLPHLGELAFARPRREEIALAYGTGDGAKEEGAVAVAASAIVTLCQSLSLENILLYLLGALLEKQMVVITPNLGTLSGVVLALLPLLRPFMWQSVLLPVLPQQLLAFLDAPVPFVVGCQYKTQEVRSRSTHMIRVNVYKNKITAFSTPDLPRRKQLVAELLPFYAAINKTTPPRRRRPVYKPSPEETTAVAGMLGVLRRYFGGLCSEIRRHTITDVQDSNEKVSLLLKDSFIDSFNSADRPFMKAFVETQMFDAYTDNLLSHHTGS